MKNTLLLSLTLLFTVACQDFTEKNLELADNGNPNEVSAGEFLLSNKSQINRGEFTLNKLLANVGVFVVSPLVSQLNQNIDSFSHGLDQYCAALSVMETIDKEDLDVLKKPLQEQWIDSMRVFHQLELMKFGPATDPSSTAVDSIYTFTGEDKCRVDLQLLQVQRGRFPRFDVINNYSVRGFDAIEPLIFGDPDISRCTRTNRQLDNFFARPLIERENVACLYMQHITKDMVQKGVELNDAWSESKGRYAFKMLKNKEKATIEVVNQVSQALFALDTVIKDVKVSYPAGFEIRINDVIQKCPAAACPDSREHPYSELSLESLYYSILGFKHLFTGTNVYSDEDGYGFDDLLRTRGFKKLASQMIEHTESLLTTLEKLNKETTLKDLLKDYSQDECQQTDSKNRVVEACALVWDLRKVTNLLKNEYLVALSELSAPRNASGDND